MFYYFFDGLVTSTNLLNDLENLATIYVKVISTKYFKFKMASQHCYGLVF